MNKKARIVTTSGRIVVKYVTSKLGHPHNNLKQKEAVRIYAEHFGLTINVPYRDWLFETYQNKSFPHKPQKKKIAKPESTPKIRREFKSVHEKLETIATERAENLRVKATKAELVLKDVLEDKGIVFEFQKPIANANICYVVDFWFERSKRRPIAVELDGGYHFTHKQIVKDKDRQKKITKAKKAIFLRFKNKDVLTNPYSVVEVILSYLEGERERKPNKELTEIQKLRRKIRRITGNDYSHISNKELESSLMRKG